MTSRNLEYVDLFAGAGGLSVGLEKAGFDLVHAVEVNEDARETFALNREGWEPEDVTGDIRDINKANISNIVDRESVDLVAGGPPCQGFSEVVSPDGSDDRNHLFTHFINWVDELDPEAALFENVRGIQNTADGKFLDAVRESFDQMGYDVTHRIVTASEFGVPQHRRRLIVLASKKDRHENPFDGFEVNPIREPGVMDGIGDLPELGPGEQKMSYACEPQTVIQRDLRGDSGKVGSHIAAQHTEDMVEMISHIPDGGNRDAIPDEMQPSSGYHNSYSRLKSDEPAVAITSNMSKPSSARCIHPFQHRGLTPREGARLQTFPDEYVFEGGLQAKRQQIGNAVPPYLGETLGYYLKQAVYNEGLTEENKERIYRIRASALTLEEFNQKSSEIGGFAQQATLDFAD
ncbi:DNA cytosine methyltransferase [Haloarcula rubripromontorii]|uniref:DNA cytosine methyltransferase n=1 Tax=Haloarcula rubripromontorii TaxID=1705562 RepID=UPI00097C576F|nr:DNA cytosine methyltransferase [Haloarcula rubripromontorii]